MGEADDCRLASSRSPSAPSPRPPPPRSPNHSGSSPEDGIDGENAGQIHEPRGVAVDPVDGHVFLADSFNSRIAEFDGWGQFVKAWGYGVVRGGAAGSGELSAGSKEVTSVTVTAKAFEVGQALTGTGIPADTQITDVGVGTLTPLQPGHRLGQRRRHHIRPKEPATSRSTSARS